MLFFAYNSQSSGVREAVKKNPDRDRTGEPFEDSRAYGIIIPFTGIPLPTEEIMSEYKVSLLSKGVSDYKRLGLTPKGKVKGKEKSMGVTETCRKVLNAAMIAAGVPEDFNITKYAKVNTVNNKQGRYMYKSFYYPEPQYNYSDTARVLDFPDWKDYLDIPKQGSLDFDNPDTAYSAEMQNKTTTTTLPKGNPAKSTVRKIPSPFSASDNAGIFQLHNILPEAVADNGNARGNTLAYYFPALYSFLPYGNVMNYGSKIMTAYESTEPQRHLGTMERRYIPPVPDIHFHPAIGIDAGKYCSDYHSQIDWSKDSILIKAPTGSGKTRLIIEEVKRRVDSLPDPEVVMEGTYRQFSYENNKKGWDYPDSEGDCTEQQRLKYQQWKKGMESLRIIDDGEPRVVFRQHQTFNVAVWTARTKVKQQWEAIIAEYGLQAYIRVYCYQRATYEFNGSDTEFFSSCQLMVFDEYHLAPEFERCTYEEGIHAFLKKIWSTYNGQKIIMSASVDFEAAKMLHTNFGQELTCYDFEFSQARKMKVDRLFINTSPKKVRQYLSETCGLVPSKKLVFFNSKTKLNKAYKYLKETFPYPDNIFTCYSDESESDPKVKNEKATDFDNAKDFFEHSPEPCILLCTGRVGVGVDFQPEYPTGVYLFNFKNRPDKVTGSLKTDVRETILQMANRPRKNVTEIGVVTNCHARNLAKFMVEDFLELCGNGLLTGIDFGEFYVPPAPIPPTAIKENKEEKPADTKDGTEVTEEAEGVRTTNVSNANGTENNKDKDNQTGKKKMLQTTPVQYRPGYYKAYSEANGTYIYIDELIVNLADLNRTMEFGRVEVYHVRGFDLAMGEARTSNDYKLDQAVRSFTFPALPSSPQGEGNMMYNNISVNGVEYKITEAAPTWKEQQNMYLSLYVQGYGNETKRWRWTWANCNSTDEFFCKYSEMEKAGGGKYFTEFTGRPDYYKLQIIKLRKTLDQSVTNAELGEYMLAAGLFTEVKYYNHVKVVPLKKGDATPEQYAAAILKTPSDFDIVPKGDGTADLVWVEKHKEHRYPVVQYRIMDRQYRSRYFTAKQLTDIFPELKELKYPHKKYSELGIVRIKLKK